MCICTYVCVYIYIYTHIYREREREIYLSLVVVFHTSMLEANNTTASGQKFSVQRV